MTYKRFIKSYPTLYVWAKDHKHLLSNISKHLPIDYITQTSTYGDLNISKSVLIPRYETLTLIKLANDIIKTHNISKIADIGSGSGVIGLGIVKDNPNITIDFIDKNKKALKIIRINIKNEKFKYNLICDDLLNNYEGPTDLVVANLPYIPSYKIMTLPLSVVKFEPRMALDGGRNGTRYIVKLIRQIADKKIPFSLLEIYEDHELPLTKVIKQYSFMRYRFIKDSYENIRFLLIEI